MNSPIPQQNYVKIHYSPPRKGLIERQNHSVICSYRFIQSIYMYYPLLGRRGSTV